jgi:phosphatidylglycerol:prolipoprotein diacylglycerol transferase
MMNFLNTNVPNPIAFEVFGVNIMWYGVLIGVGVLLGEAVVFKRAYKHDIASEKTLEILIFSLIMGIIGARIYYVLFNWSQFSGDFMAIINIRQGGLAVHGGLILGFLTGFLLCLLWNIRPLNAFDLFAPGVVLAQSIGRWGNYFNSEAHGGPTDLPWGILVDGQLVHPTFLYESLWCFAIFWVLIFIDNRRTFDGQTFLWYCALYSFGRFFIEELRTDSLMLGAFKQAQVLSVLVFVACIIALIVLSRNNKNKGRIFFGR